MGDSKCNIEQQNQAPMNAPKNLGYPVPLTRCEPTKCIANHLIQYPNSQVFWFFRFRLCCKRKLVLLCTWLQPWQGPVSSPMSWWRQHTAASPLPTERQSAPPPKVHHNWTTLKRFCSYDGGIQINADGFTWATTKRLIVSTSTLVDPKMSSPSYNFEEWEIFFAKKQNG